jgi:flagellar hook-length control protein FliK
MPRLRPAQSDRAPTPFESLLDDAAPAAEATHAPRESNAPAGDSTPAPTKSKDCKATAPGDDTKAETAKPDDAVPIDSKPADEEKTNDGTKKTAGVQITGEVGESIKADQDQKSVFGDKTDVKTYTAPTNDGATAIVSSDVTAVVPVSAQTTTAAPDDHAEQSQQQVALVTDAKTQVKPLDTDLPKVLAGKKIDDGKQADTDDKVEIDQPADTTQEPFQLLTKDAPAQNAETKPQADSSDGDKQRGPQGRGDIAANNQRPDMTGPAAPGADIGNAGAKVSADATAQLAMPATSTHSTAISAAPAAPTPQATPQPVAIPLSGVAVEIAGKALAGKNRFEIRLDPPELGRIDVRLDVDRDGNVTSRLTVDRPDTLDLLRRDATGLERALQDAGLKTANNGLQFSLRDQSLNDQQTGRAPDTAIMVANDEALPSVDAIPQRYGRLAGQGSGLDIRV